MYFLIEGQVVSKANSRRLVTFKGKPRIIKSDKALKFTRDMIIQLKAQMSNRERWPLTYPIKIDVSIYYPSNRQDLDASLIMDGLQKAGVIENDRQVFELFARKKFDKDCPRAEIYVSEIESEE